MKQFARKLRHGQTDAEKRLWYFLRSRQFLGMKFRRQHVIEPYIVDFFCLEKKLIIELDGSQHSRQVLKDQRRNAFLNQKGFRVLRFWDHDVLKETASVLEAIRLRVVGPSPCPLPAGEGT